MRKYVLTDAAGYTASKQKLVSGKFIHNTQSTKDLLTRIADCCCSTPLLAALVSPFTAPQAKLFMINRWNVSADQISAQSYTVVQEVTPAPAVALDQKLDFAIALIRHAYANSDFRHWAEKWLAGTDRSAASARATRKAIEQERDAAEGLAALAAWGELGTNDTDAIDDQAARAVQVVKAAELIASKPIDADQAAQMLARALADIERVVAPADLARLMQEVVGDVTTAQPTPVGRSQR